MKSDKPVAKATNPCPDAPRPCLCADRETPGHTRWLNSGHPQGESADAPVRAAAGDHAATLLLCCSRASVSSFAVASRSSAPGRCAGYGAGWRTMRTRAELILGMTQSIGIAGWSVVCIHCRTSSPFLSHLAPARRCSRGRRRVGVGVPGPVAEGAALAASSVYPNTASILGPMTAPPSRSWPRVRSRISQIPLEPGDGPCSQV
jgi:hypothetical protein